MLSGGVNRYHIQYAEACGLCHGREVRGGKRSVVITGADQYGCLRGLSEVAAPVDSICGWCRDPACIGLL
jgi:hypothetical protein